MGSPGGGIAGALWRFFVTEETYAAEWLTGAALIGITGGVTGRISPVNPAAGPIEQFTQAGIVRDPAFLLTYTPTELVSTTALYLITFVPPGVAFVLAQWWVRSWRDLHASYLAAFIAFVLAFVFKNWMNVGAGRLRPDWYYRVALNDPAELAEGHLSYPSGHAAYSASTLTVMGLYLMSKVPLRFPGRMHVCLGLFFPAE